MRRLHTQCGAAYDANGTLVPQRWDNLAALLLTALLTALGTGIATAQDSDAARASDAVPGSEAAQDSNESQDSDAAEKAAAARPAMNDALLARLISREVTSVTEDDAFIVHVFSMGDSSRFEEAVEAYLRLITAKDITPQERRIVLRHLLCAFDVIPKSLQPTHPSAEGETASAGKEIARWWRRQDPFPITRRNERLEEHLSRWVTALERFTNGKDDRGFDDRGEIYVRFGSPGKRLSVQLNESMVALDFNTTMMVPKLADNEVWVYRHVHDEAYYFFVRDSNRDGYRVARPSETIPYRLRDGLNYTTSRGRNKTDMLLLVMEEFYAQLALAHPIFGPTHDEIVRFRGLPPSRTARPDQFARSMLAFASTVETESAGRRNDVVPASFTDTKGLTETLPLESRWARFLDTDGTTRTEIYWSVDTSQLEPSRRHERRLVDAGHKPTESYLLSVSVRQQAEDYRNRGVHVKHYRLDPTPEKPLQAQAFTVRGDTGVYNLAAQWSQHWTRELEDGLRGEGPMLKLTTVRLDSLNALHGGGEQLEMSDLKPIFPARPNVPYPFVEIRRDMPPDLYFELYNLHFDADDRTRFTVEYEVSQASETGDRSDALPTRVRSTYSGSERVAREHIGLDLGEWRGAVHIRITVRATDEVTSEQVERAVTFKIEE